MSEAFIIDGLRTPIGRYAGALSGVRADDLAAHPIRKLMERNAGLTDLIDEVVLGCANQAGEDNRNVARMAVLLSGLPESVPAITLNRLCGSGLDAIGHAARLIKTGEADLVIAGGVESMSRAPYVQGKSDTPFSRTVQLYDSTIGWRFVNSLIESQYGIESMPETAENLAAELKISRADQDVFALQSQTRALASQARLAREIVPLEIDKDEHPRETSLAKLGQLRTPFREGGTVTAGNASGVNDGAAALLIASGRAVEKYGLSPLARIVGMATAGVPPRIMGIGPVPATEKLLRRHGLSIADLDLIELNEAFAAQVLAVLRSWHLPEDSTKLNPHGGAIALGHPLGMSGARLALSSARTLADRGTGRALVTMCVGVGQGVSLLLDRGMA
ncbi:MAG TPA: 3-oxoadipyl-CoA thiolase [Magnetospirillaceae bacterium]|nr:3-oxoadipyl-CoA thiolase [Magnetospirillaceae bacterium]